MKETVLKEALGIDVSKASLSMCLGSLTNDLSKDFEPREDVTNDNQGFRELSSWLKSATKGNEKPIVVMEATGVYHEGVAQYLYDKGYKVSVMQSGRVKRYAQSLDQRSKTDALDSKMLSMLGCERELQTWEPPSELMQHLKSLSRERSTLIKERSIENNRQQAIESSIYQDKRAQKRFNQRMKLLASQLTDIEEEMLELTQSDGELSTRLTYPMSIPGVSFITAITVIAETSGFSLIKSGKQLTSYAGYDVVLRDSGPFKGKTRISKKGNKHIRAVLHMPSMAAIRFNPTMKVFYQRLKPNKIKPIVALVAVQRKMLILMYTLWTNEENYDGEYEQKKAARNQVPSCTG